MTGRVIDSAFDKYSTGKFAQCAADTYTDKNIFIMKHWDSKTLWRKWQLYPEPRKQAILEEFRRKLPGDYYSKEHLLLFLRDKFEHKRP